MTQGQLEHLLRRPVVVAPMAGGPSNPGLVTAAADAGALGFLAAGYKTVAAMTSEIAAVRAATSQPFGINVFVPSAGPSSDRTSLDAYLRSLESDLAAVDANPGAPTWDDDDFAAKIDALLVDPPPVVSFTFGCPPAEIIAQLQAAGALVAITVTDSGEASTATASGADALCVQGPEAGGHRGTFDNDPRRQPDVPLLALVSQVALVTDLPVIAAGGIMRPEHVDAVLASGAVAAQCGTAFLRCRESGTHPLHQAALADPHTTTTAVTRAFSGRPARGLVNQFIRDHADAPAAYPEINNATRPLRAAAAAKGDPERMSMWAGQGYREARAGSAAEIIEWLCPAPRP